MSDPVPTAEEIAALEQQYLKMGVELAEKKRALPPEPVKDYELTDLSGEAVKLSTLFGDKTDLIVIHNMGKGCTYCTLWADGFNGFTPHLENRAGFVVCTPDAPDVIQEFKDSRGWTFSMVSGQGSDFTKDMGYAPDGQYHPGVSTFQKQEDGSLVRIATSYLGPNDPYCSIWHLFNLLADESTAPLPDRVCSI